MSEEGENICRLRFCVYPYSAMSNRDPIDQPILVPMGEYKRISRRELLRVAPLAVSGALLVPSIQKRLIHGGLALSDWASAKFFRQGLRAPTFRDSEVTPFASFPYNYSSLLARNQSRQLEPPRRRACATSGKLFTGANPGPAQDSCLPCWCSRCVRACETALKPSRKEWGPILKSRGVSHTTGGQRCFTG